MRRRLVSAASTLAFGLGVTMAGSLGFAARGFGGGFVVPAATLALVPTPRDPFGDRVTPTEPDRLPVPLGPAPGVHVTRVDLPPLPRGVTAPPRGVPAILAVLFTAALLGLAVVTSFVDDAECFGLGWGWTCEQHFEVTPQVVAALAVFVAALAAFAREGLRPNTGPDR